MTVKRHQCETCRAVETLQPERCFVPGELCVFGGIEFMAGLVLGESYSAEEYLS